MTGNKTCCFQGYSLFELSYGDNNTDTYIKLKSAIKHVIERLIGEGYKYFICGFDRGSDLLFAETLVLLKSKYPDIFLESVIPYEGQASDWSENERELYFNLLANCDKETMACKHYIKDCFADRNKYMVTKSDTLVTVYDVKLSMTMQTVNFATRICKRVICINPETFLVTESKPAFSSKVIY